jgi:hypothetical protein
MSSKREVSRWFQYLYFLRFSILTWLFLPVLCALDLGGVTSTLTRGILTLDSGWQAYYAAFFVVALNMAVLITARNTVRNGQSRFRSTAPGWLYNALTDSSAKAVWTVLGVVQSFTLITLGYLAYIAHREGEQYSLSPSFSPKLFAPHTRYILVFFAAGVAAAILFWYLVSLFYYWTYRPSVNATGKPDPKDIPAALIFPHSKRLFGDINTAVPPPRLMFCFDGLTKVILKWVSCPGYAVSAKAPLWELHFLSALSLVGIFLLYLFLYPLTGPVTRGPLAVYGQIAFCLAVTATFLAMISDKNYRNAVPNGQCHWARPVKWTFIGLALGLAGLFIAMLLFDNHTRSVRLAMAFPTFGSILVLAGFFAWFFGGAAFYLDRYRVPVLTTVLALIFVPKLVEPSVNEFFMRHGYPRLAQTFDSDHYYSVKALKEPVSEDTIPTPAEVLDLRAPASDKPYIIVTASGGGIQAAEWTAQVLANLEQTIATDGGLQSHGYTFHDHLLLASGVSGGSVGLLPFLLEYTAYEEKDAKEPVTIFPANHADLVDRIIRPAGCSSLEAVGWGLAYHDFYRLVVPIRIPSLTDDASLADDTSPDRSWALASAFNRNLHDEHCDTNRDTRPGHEQFADLPAIRDGEGVTLLDGARRLRHKTFPAFTFNTTAAETGSRFLLSNYFVPRDASPCSGSKCTDFIPAESFLQDYAQDGRNSDGSVYRPLRYADLPLATAARLSATFPIVSSGTRIPPAYTDHAYHFLDGGYFDNDGTASVVEFLKSALDGSGVKTPHKILLIEIRDDDGAGVTTDLDNLARQNADVNDAKTLQAPPWTPFSQLTGIFEGLWNAGHVSIARRNRRELCIFEKTYHDAGLDIHHVVFTIPNGGDQLSPLSWNLTTGQLASITGRVKTVETQATIAESVHWLASVLGSADYREGDEVCKAYVEPSSSTPLPKAKP